MRPRDEERSGRGRGVLAAVAVIAGGAVLVAASCSLVLDGELGPVRCQLEGALGPPACPEGQACAGGLCVPPAAASAGTTLGHPCAVDADCGADAFCLDPATVGAVGEKRCSRACCSSHACGPPGLGQVCLALATGSGALCFAHAEAGRDAPGELGAGEACTAGGACRSGLCEGGACLDHCCSDVSCTVPGERCRTLTTALNERPSYSCAKPPGGKDAIECDSDDDCASARCVRFGQAGAGGGGGGPPKKGVCARPCCSSSGCGVVVVGSFLVGLACGPVEDGAIAGLACVVERSVDATKQLGASCKTNDECVSGRCATDGGGQGICADVCCDDASCGDTSRWSCRPGAAGRAWVLQCVRK
jgi:hypothetical protein